MKIDVDLLRKIILCLEKEATRHDGLQAEDFIGQHFQDSGYENMRCHLDFLEQKGVLSYDRDRRSDYTQLTAHGHDCAERMRNKEAWSMAKNYQERHRGRYGVTLMTCFNFWSNGHQKN